MASHKHRDAGKSLRAASSRKPMCAADPNVLAAARKIGAFHFLLFIRVLNLPTALRGLGLRLASAASVLGSGSGIRNPARR